MREAPRLIAGCLFAMAALAASLCPASAEDGDAFARAAALDAAGRPGEAAAILEPLLSFYPQDYALPLQIAALYERAGHLAVAESFYRVAIARSPGGIDARTGLAHVLEAEGRPEEALPLWEGLARELPDFAPARAGVARCKPFHVTLSLGLAGTVFPDHPSKFLAGGGYAGALFTHRTGFFLGAEYRYAHFVPASGSGLSPWDQHDGYFHLGWARPAGGFALHYAIVADQSGLFGTSHHVGFSARWSPFGDLGLEGAASFYDDGTKVLRIEPSWRIPIAFGLSARPALALQDAAGEALATGSLTLALDRDAFSLWAGGKYGDEVRPVYFAVPVVYDVVERIPYGAYAGLRVNVNADVRIHLAYAMDALKEADGTTTLAHSVALGTSFTF